MANAKVISFVDHQVSAAIDAMTDEMIVQLEDFGVVLREDVRKAVEYTVGQLRKELIFAIDPMQRAIRQLREDVDRLQQGGGSPPG